MKVVSVVCQPQQIIGVSSQEKASRMMGIKKDNEQTLGAGEEVYHVMLLFLIQCHFHTTRDGGKFCLLPPHLLFYQKLFRPFPLPPTVVAVIGLVISSGPLGCEIEFTHVGTQLEDHAHMGTYRLGIHPSMPSCHQQP